MNYKLEIQSPEGEILNTLELELAKFKDTIEKGSKKNLPRVYAFYEKGNEDLCKKLSKQIGKSFRIESNEINGVFKVTKIDGGIKLNEIFNGESIT